MKIIKKINKILRSKLIRGNREISYVQAKEILKENITAVLLDVRSKQEHEEYHLNGDICIPLYELQQEIIKIIENKETIIVVYCQSGARGKKALTILQKMGYQNVYNICGGIEEI